MSCGVSRIAPTHVISQNFVVCVGPWISSKVNQSSPVSHMIYDLSKVAFNLTMVSDDNYLYCPAMLDLGPASSDCDNTQRSSNIFEVILSFGNHSA